MGFEYILKFKDVENFNLESLESKWNNPTNNGWDAFSIKKNETGLYFCDNGRSVAAALAFKEIIDEILLYSDSVSIEEI